MYVCYVCLCEEEGEDNEERTARGVDVTSMIVKLAKLIVNKKICMCACVCECVKDNGL